MDYYKQIFKRKSFHLFRETEQMTKEDINQLNAFIGSVKPLNPQIKTEICSDRVLYADTTDDSVEKRFLRNMCFMLKQSRDNGNI